MKAKTTKKKDENKMKLCTQDKCKNEVKTKGYCRLHYLANWKHIRFDDHIKAERRLNSYIDKIAKKYPKDYLDKIKEGLEDEGKFKQVVDELEVEVQADAPDTDNEFLEKFMRVVKPGEK